MFNNDFAVGILFFWAFIQCGNSLGISTKLDFPNQQESNNRGVRDSSLNPRSVSIIKPATYRDQLTELNNAPVKSNILQSNTVIVNHNSNDLNSNQLNNPKVQCDNQKCVVNYVSGRDGTSTGGSKISTDVHVKISTGVHDVTAIGNSEEDDIPVIKGYIGVKPEDINYKEQDANELKKEEPLIILNYDNPNIVKSEAPDVVLKPSIFLKPPIYRPMNWHDYNQWKTKPVVVPNTYQHYYPIGAHGIDKNDRNTNTEHFNDGVNDIKPASGGGSVSNWQPMLPGGHQSPGDLHHQNGNGKGDVFPVWSPRLVTYCKCVRKPAHEPPPPGYGPSHGFVPHWSPNYPWRPIETTTKVTLDDKLLPPFSKNKNNT